MDVWTAGEPSKPKVKARRRRTGHSSSLPRSKWSKEINNHVKGKTKKKTTETWKSNCLHLLFWVSASGVHVCVFQECDTLSPAEGAVEQHIYLLQLCSFFLSVRGKESSYGWMDACHCLNTVCHSKQYHHQNSFFSSKQAGSV